jgi:hypothetical protein
MIIPEYVLGHAAASTTRDTYGRLHPLPRSGPTDQDQ